MFSLIGFAIQVVAAAILVIPLFLSKNSPIPRERIGLFAIVSVVSATLTIVAARMDSGMVVAGLIVAIGIVSFSQFQKEDQWLDALWTVIPFWLVSAIGICVGVGVGMILPAIFLTGLSYYIINYLPMLLGGDKKTGESE